MSSVAPIRILVVDDHTLFRRGLTALLSRDPQVQVVGDAADAGQALRRAQQLQPDIILLDNHLPGVNGVDALPALREAAPGARILILTVSEDETDLAASLRGGAVGGRGVGSAGLDRQPVAARTRHPARHLAWREQQGDRS